MDEITTEQIAEAMQMAWNDYCTDTHEFPDVLTTGHDDDGVLVIYADMSRGNFAALVAGSLAQIRLRDKGHS